MSTPITKIPDELNQYPQTIQAIMETEGIFADGTPALKTGTSWMPMKKSIDYVEVCVNGETQRRRITHPYTSYEERLAECIKLHEAAKPGLLGRDNEINRKMRDGYLAQVMRGNITIGS